MDENAEDMTSLLTGWKKRFREEGERFLKANETHLNGQQVYRLGRFFAAAGDPDILRDEARFIRQVADGLEGQKWQPTKVEGDAVKLPPHYNRFPYEPVKFIVTVGLGYLEANVVKYICRYPHKNGVEDLRKAARSLEMLAKFNDGDPNWST